MRELKTDIDAIEYAIEQEIDAHSFYLALAKWSGNLLLQDFFRTLARTEQEHKHKLELELMKLGRTVKETQLENEDDVEISTYVVGAPNGDMDIADALRLAMEKEDASFQLYVSMYSDSKNAHLKEVLLAIAQQEVRHKLLLEIELETLTA